MKVRTPACPAKMKKKYKVVKALDNRDGACPRAPSGGKTDAFFS
jgi:hypothetical protein